MKPPKAGVTVRVGVIGHCPEHISGEELAASARVLQEVLSLIRECARHWAKEHIDLCGRDTATVRVISCMAEGVDRVAARLAMAKDFELQAVLPFSRAECEKDFASDKSAAEFREILENKNCTSVIELDGGRSPSLCSASYEAAGRTLLQQSDLVVAIWNGDKALGPGGTSQIAIEAAQQRIPVIWIYTKSPDEWTIASAVEDLAASSRIRTKYDRAAELAELCKIVLQIVEPPTSDVAELRKYLSEKEPSINVGQIWQTFLRLTSGSTLSEEPSEVACAIGEQLKPKEAAIAGWRTEAPDSCMLDGIVNKQIEDKLAEHYGWADALAAYYTALYRASFLANYILAAAAVGSALIGSALGWTEASHPLHRFTVIFNICEVACLVVILLNTGCARKMMWHRRALDYRLLAEWIRQYRFILPLAGSRMRANRARYLTTYGKPDESWMHWLLRAIIREAGLLTLKMEPTFLKQYQKWAGCALLRAQADYHRAIVRVVGKANHNLHQVMLVCFLTSLAGCFLHFFVHSAWIEFMAAVLPAIGSACGAIRVQGEFDKVVKQSRAMCRSMDEVATDFAAMELNPQALDSTRLSRHINEATALLNEETVGWNTVFQDKPVDLA